RLATFAASPLPRPCLRPPRPPSSTLFPYTTLFRSLVQPPFHLVAGGRADGRFDARVREPPHQHVHGPVSEATHLLGVEPQRIVVDRKSTRLNSSHVAISYAVFCLKKKNKEQKSHHT